MQRSEKLLEPICCCREDSETFKNWSFIRFCFALFITARKLIIPLFLLEELNCSNINKLQFSAKHDAASSVSLIQFTLLFHLNLLLSRRFAHSFIHRAELNSLARVKNASENVLIVHPPRGGEIEQILFSIVRQLKCFYENSCTLIRTKNASLPLMLLRGRRGSFN